MSLRFFVETLHREISTDSYTESVRVGTNNTTVPRSTLRIVITKDFYVFQSKAKIQKWTGAGWAEVWSIHPKLIATTESGDTFDVFEKDRDALLTIALPIVTGYEADSWQK